MLPIEIMNRINTYNRSEEAEFIASLSGLYRTSMKEAFDRGYVTEEQFSFTDYLNRRHFLKPVEKIGHRVFGELTMYRQMFETRYRNHHLYHNESFGKGLLRHIAVSKALAKDR
jgi:hypothetical protein